MTVKEINNSHLTYEERCSCSRDAFCRFIDKQTSFSANDKNNLQRKIVDAQISGILYVCTVLTGWSLIALWVDSALIPFVIIYMAVGDFADLGAFTIPIIFLILNAIMKFVYIRYTLGNHVSITDSLLAVVPYIGAAFLLRKWLANDVILRRAVFLFLKERKRQLIRRIRHSFISLFSRS